MLVYDVIQIICNHSTLKTKMNMLRLNKHLNSNLRIYSFYDAIEYDFMEGLKVEPDISHKITPEVLKQHKYYEYLM